MNKDKMRKRKIFILIFLVISTSLIATILPSLARIKNRTISEALKVWDGTTAVSYRKGSGTKDNPYVIANGQELSYFSQMLKTTNYEGKYFILSNDILLNSGFFSYDDKITYTLNNSKFYIKNHTGDFYDNKNTEGVKIGSVNIMQSFENFKGHFDGNSHTIFGLYTTSNEQEVGIFKNLQGEVTNLYVSNSAIDGGNITGGIASSTNNAKLSNISFSGVVKGNEQIKRSDKTFDLLNQTLEVSPITFDIDEHLKNISGLIISKNLSGTCRTNFSLNDEPIECINGQFSTVLESNTLTFQSEETQELNNLILKATYDEGFTGGLIGLAKNTNLENVFNKAQVQGSLISGGLVGTAETKINIDKSYNTGNIEATTLKSGLIGKINYLEAPSTIKLSYNEGNSTSLIGVINNSSNNLTLQSIVEANSTSKLIEEINNSTLNLIDTYSITSLENTENINGQLNTITIEELKSKDTMITLGFNEFQDPENLKTNRNNAWIYEDGYLPILYIDDIKEPLATLNLSTYAWNNLGFDTKKIYFNQNIAFSISEISSVRPIKEAYYYLSKSETPLTKENIDTIANWTPYQTIVPLTEEGNFCIYVKIIDSNDKVSYINSDIIVIDKTSSEVSLKSDSQTWNSLNEEPLKTFIDTDTEFTIEATDILSGIKSIEYHVASSKIAKEELTNINWLTYENNITISYTGTHIIYVKVIDNAGNSTIINSDYIVYAGFTLESLTIGDNEPVSQVASINNLSDVTYKFNYHDNIPYKETDTHNLITSTPLPKGTKITLKNNIDNKIYTYTVKNSQTVYPFKDFNELGKMTMHNFFRESATTENIEESFSIKLDFKKSEILNDIKDLKVYLEIRDEKNNINRSTLKNTLKPLNIYQNQNASLSISGTFANENILYNSDSLEKVELSTKLNYKEIETAKIYDTSFKDMNLGIAIRLENSNGDTITKDNLKNIQFKMNDKYYSPDNDGITRIQVGETLDENSELIIITSKTKTTLEPGTYYFKIYSFMAYGGLYGNTRSEEEVSIPVIVQNETSNISYDFDVKTEEDYRVLFKENNAQELNFNITESSDVSNPNIRVSLYKKDKLTAYDQTYSILDLQEYSNTTLEKALDTIYYAVKNPLEYENNRFTLELDLTKLKKGGYKFVFELYNSNKKIGTIEKKFIIR